MDSERLIENAAVASQNKTLIDCPVTVEAIELNIINPLLDDIEFLARRWCDHSVHPNDASEWERIKKERLDK